MGRQCNVNHAGNGNKTALYWATDNSKVEIVRELLRNEMEIFESTLDKLIVNNHASLAYFEIHPGRADAEGLTN